MSKIELFINSLDFSDLVAVVIQNINKDGFSVKLRRINKAGRMAKLAELYNANGWAVASEKRLRVAVYCKADDKEYVFPDAYTYFEHRKITFEIRRPSRGGYLVPEQYRAELQRAWERAAAARIAAPVPPRLVWEPPRNARNAPLIVPERPEIEPPNRYWVGVDMARAQADISVFAERFADTTGQSQADIENNIQQAIDRVLLEGDTESDE